ncbi:hypothetical protein ElyMa_001715700 [Elysia marginata]|uniref:Transmembrane protein n=1 Tax=Elysia marginata TaxID=1093978 RepID=A0AAV4JXC4_9GAST|nr:hypothetical protein ElyMa_001715700 [Elysia marginata]
MWKEMYLHSVLFLAFLQFIALQNSPPFLNLERDLWTSPLPATSMFVNTQAFNQPDPRDGTLIISPLYPSSETSLLKLSLVAVVVAVVHVGLEVVVTAVVVIK